MRPILCLSILLASAGWADQLDDRASIEKVISTLNTSTVNRGAFTVDFRFSELTQLWSASGLWTIGPGTVVISHEPWGEAQWVPATALPPQAPLRLVVRSVRFITSDVALVDAVTGPPTAAPASAAEREPYKSVAPQRVPMLLVMKREVTDWRIASIRKAAPL
jgi:hypothetical protein